VPDRLRRLGGVSVPGLPDAARHDLIAAPAARSAGDLYEVGRSYRKRHHARAC
jgi:hypothetical protein